jgi:predicted ATP-grasp superfamily ATP-dependent carboligase
VDSNVAAISGRSTSPKVYRRKRVSVVDMGPIQIVDEQRRFLQSETFSGLKDRNYGFDSP